MKHFSFIAEYSDFLKYTLNKLKRNWIYSSPVLFTVSLSTVSADHVQINNLRFTKYSL